MLRNHEPLETEWKGSSAMRNLYLWAPLKIKMQGGLSEAKPAEQYDFAGFAACAA
jgi:hypothetical protein